METYEIIIREKKYINQAEAQVEVSFQLPFHDWSMLEKSDAWCQVERFLQGLRNKHNQMFRQDLEEK